MSHRPQRRASDSFQVKDVVRYVKANPAKWFLPTAVCVLAAMGYALFRAPTWEATQTVLIRNEASGDTDVGLGRFRDLEEMKVSQETILEVIQSPEVLRGALATVDSVDPSTIDEMSVNDLRDSLATAPPDGAELGKTEIIYVRVKGKDQDRAKALSTAIAEAAQVGLRQLREAKLMSMVEELSESAKLNGSDLALSRDNLSSMELSLGGDLAELRMLDGSGAVDSDLHRRVNSIENELRQARESARADAELLSLLQQAQSNPASFMATPNRLLESQPALRRLKDGLVDSQLRTSKALGAMTSNHPLVAAAQAEEDEVKRSLHRELQTAIRGLEVESRLTSQRIAALETERDDLNSRLSNLAGMRAEYSAMAADVKHRTTLLENAQRKLADARASLAGVDATSLLTLVGEAKLSPRPVGLGRTMITLLGLIGGLSVGIAYTFFTMPSDVSNANNMTSSNVNGGATAAASKRRPAAGNGDSFSHNRDGFENGHPPAITLPRR